MKPVDCKWSIHWHGCDRSELFGALRTLGKDIYTEMVHNAQPLDDCDRETIQSSVEIDCLQLALDLLVATKQIKCAYGTHLHVLFNDDFVNCGANLGTGDGFDPSSASISYQRHKVCNERLLEAVQTIEKAADTLRDLSVITAETKN